ncbi:hypothetical protein NBRC111894_2359 [Sporolactobacillus inulinus]|uniref:Uncharacterized protein n=1 Tax=Sporolactobacillus inulinus TaxID=2078 RepID=A0A4Y1ZCL9_9BACL|nr:hypothetical protein NBRC111894_2359 [Sporolactobacillus inulinus]
MGCSNNGEKDRTYGFSKVFPRFDFLFAETDPDFLFLMPLLLFFVS